jgi:hypothetical protein
LRGSPPPAPPPFPLSSLLVTSTLLHFFRFIFLGYPESTLGHMSKKKAPNYCVLPVTDGSLRPNGKRASFFPVIFQSFESLPVVTDGQTDTLKGCRLSNLPVERIKACAALHLCYPPLFFEPHVCFVLGPTHLLVLLLLLQTDPSRTTTIPTRPTSHPTHPTPPALPPFFSVV